MPQKLYEEATYQEREDGIIAYQIMKGDWIARLYRTEAGYNRFGYINRKDNLFQHNRTYKDIRSAVKAVRNHQDNKYLKIWVFPDNLSFFNWCVEMLDPENVRAVNYIYYGDINEEQV